MSILSQFKTFWATNSTLNNAIPSSSLYLDFIPPSIPMPYIRFSTLASRPTLTTAQPHIETLTYQLSIFHTDLTALSNLVDTIIGVLDQSYPIAGALINTRRNRIFTGEVVNGVYTYHAILEYDLQYNTSTA